MVFFDEQTSGAGLADLQYGIIFVDRSGKMTPEKTKKLFDKYPEIFAGRTASPTENLMCFGFECGDGWYALIDALCSKLMKRVIGARRHLDCLMRVKEEAQGEGTLKYYDDIDKIIANTKMELEEATKKIPVAVQVKEKYGGLRFYVEGADEETYKTISIFEELSYRVCEECGLMDETIQKYRMGWNRTLCPVHAEDYYGVEKVLDYNEGPE